MSGALKLDEKRKKSRNWIQKILAITLFAVCLKYGVSPAHADKFEPVKVSTDEQVYAGEKQGIKLLVACGKDPRIEVQENGVGITGQIEIHSKRFRYAFQMTDGVHIPSNPEEPQEFDRLVENIRWQQYWSLDLPSNASVEFFAHRTSGFSDFCKFSREKTNLTNEEIRELQQNFKDFAGTAYRGLGLGGIYRGPIDGVMTNEFLAMIRVFAQFQQLPGGKQASMQEILAHSRVMRADSNYMSNAKTSAWRRAERRFAGIRWEVESNWRGTAKIIANGGGGALAFECVYDAQSGALPVVEWMTLSASSISLSKLYEDRSVTIQVDDHEPFQLDRQTLVVSTTAQAALFEKFVQQLVNGKVATIRSEWGDTSKIRLQGVQENLFPCLNPVYEYDLIDDAELASIRIAEARRTRLEAKATSTNRAFGNVTICNQGQTSIQVYGIHAYVNRMDVFGPAQKKAGRYGTLAPGACNEVHVYRAVGDVVGFGFNRLSADRNTWYLPNFALDVDARIVPSKKFSAVCFHKTGGGILTEKTKSYSISDLPSDVTCPVDFVRWPTHINIGSSELDVTINVY